MLALIRSVLCSVIIACGIAYAANLTGPSNQATTQPAFSDLSGSAACSQLPALAGGDTTTSAGSCVTTERMHLISTQTASGSTTAMTWSSLATYDNYYIVCNRVFPATASTNVLLQFGESGTFKTTSYKWANLALGSNNTSAANAVNAADSGINAVGGTLSNTIGAAMSFWGTMNDFTSTTATKGLVWTGRLYSGSIEYVTNGAGNYNGDTGAITDVRVTAASGNLNGKCSLYAFVQ